MRGRCNPRPSRLAEEPAVDRLLVAVVADGFALSLALGARLAAEGIDPARAEDAPPAPCFP